MYKILANTLFLGKKVIYMPSCHSTNDLGLQIIQNTDTIEGTVIVTDDQKKGRGQRGNSWISEPNKNLMLSIILKPSFVKPADHFVLNMAVSLGVRATIADFLPSTTCNVKWPNDLFIGRSKIAGILIENSVRSGSIENSVIGIGLNVNQLDFGGLEATSLLSENGGKKEFDRIHVFEQLISNIEAQYLKVKSNKTQELKEYYLQHLLGFKQSMKFKSEYDFEGIIEGIDSNGRLMVGVNGKVEVFDFKEIEFLL
ncbi:biotin--[acetyl-CoA-carboxylase] ligase [Roseivirga misakiensis]|uniref:Biotin--[acetyl-CoA-carboxylase] ligase n=1 Tax=Roseivirga misakiensis TaxID=1563681 RepID=A0A1E5T2T7_9BACT|nr:biotin--[acetyl-CoA-carboxylase] ligase [Roseivirga misakiensis]OEK05661.1 biotin--[acetyl-CoA-carboxylase] ligase [Roseivirga misakiensis]